MFRAKPIDPKLSYPLLIDYLSGFTAARLCSGYNLTLPQLFAWRRHPDTQALLDEHEQFAADQVRHVQHDKEPEILLTLCAIATRGSSESESRRAASDLLRAFKFREYLNHRKNNARPRNLETDSQSTAPESDESTAPPRSGDAITRRASVSPARPSTSFTSPGRPFPSAPATSTPHTQNRTTLPNQAPDSAAQPTASDPSDSLVPSPRTFQALDNLASRAEKDATLDDQEDDEVEDFLDKEIEHDLESEDDSDKAEDEDSDSDTDDEVDPINKGNALDRSPRPSNSHSNNNAHQETNKTPTTPNPASVPSDSSVPSDPCVPSIPAPTPALDNSAAPHSEFPAPSSPPSLCEEILDLPKEVSPYSPNPPDPAPGQPLCLLSKDSAPLPSFDEMVSFMPLPSASFNPFWPEADILYLCYPGRTDKHHLRDAIASHEEMLTRRGAQVLVDRFHFPREQQSHQAYCAAADFYKQYARKNPPPDH